MIYLKIERPEGKPFHFITPGTNQRDTSKKPVVLFNSRDPNRPLTKDEETWLLEQDPKLVCREVPKFSKKFPTKEAKLDHELKEQKAVVDELRSNVNNLEKKLANVASEPEKIETLTVRNKELGEQVKLLIEENKDNIATIARLNKEVVELTGPPTTAAADTEKGDPKDKSK